MIDWTTFLDLARELAERTGSEAAERSAISRAYYAAFHVARDYLDRRGPAVSRTGAAHAEVRDRLMWIERSIGQDLKQLHTLRKRADYDDEYARDLSLDALGAVHLADKLIARIAAHSKP